MTSFKKQFREALKYLLESRNYIYAIVFIFLASALAGFVFSGQLGYLDGFLREIVSRVEGLSTAGLMFFIFKNNLQSAFLGLFLGAILGIFSIVNCMTNGVVLGYVAKIVSEKSGFIEMWRILPHGIFELPAVFISLALGLRLGMFIFAKNRKKEFLYRLGNSAVIYLAIVIPLLIVAAVIEGILIFAYSR